MPGKVNPTQCEMVLMVCARVLGNDVTMGVAGASGVLELNVMKPLLVATFLQSAHALGGAADAFTRHALAGLEPDERRISEHVGRSLMLVTALAPAIGYDRAAAIAKHAHAEGVTLREAAIALGAVSAEEFDRLVRPEAMVGSATSRSGSSAWGSATPTAWTPRGSRTTGAARRPRTICATSAASVGLCRSNLCIVVS